MLILPEGRLRPSLALYNPQAVTGLVAKSAIRAACWRGDSLALDSDALAELETLIGDALGERDVRCAFHAGADGPAAKVVALVMDRKGRQIAYAKIASTDRAKKALGHEASMLEQVGGYPELTGGVPMLLAAVDWREVQIILISAGPNQRARRRFGFSHSACLNRLGEVTGEECSLQDTAVGIELLRFRPNFPDTLPTDWRDRFSWATEYFRKRAGDIVSTSLAHGDFAPWNTRVFGNKVLFAFDWESAVPRMTSCYDFLYFHFAWQARRGRPFDSAMANLVTETAKRFGVTMDDPQLSISAAFTWIALTRHSAEGTDRMLDFAAGGLDMLRNRRS